MGAPIVTPQGLTHQQEHFAQLVASGLNQSDAYRQAYNVSPDTLPETTHQAASILASHSNVAPRIQQLRATIEAATVAKIAWDNAKLTKEADRHRELALSGGWRGVSAANGALEIIGKVTGLLRADTVAIQVSPASASGLDGLTTEELRLLISQRQEALELMRQMRDAALPTLPQPGEESPSNTGPAEGRG